MVSMGEWGTINAEDGVVVAVVKGKTVARSRTEMTELVLPGDSNQLGNILGGKVMHWIDMAAAMTANRHAGHVAVTASMDSLQFLHPIRVGEVVNLVAQVNWVGRTSIGSPARFKATNVRNAVEVLRRSPVSIFSP